jgi:hypothetical protein
MATTIESLKQENEELRYLLEEQAGKLQRAMFAICQLHGGLYNQRTQLYILRSSNAMLFGTALPEINNENSPDIHPTTRQGDANEKRIQLLEEKVRLMEEQLENIEIKIEHVDEQAL